MFISKKKHGAIVADLQEDIDFLEERLEEAKNLKELLTTLVSSQKNYLTVDNTSGISFSVDGGYELSLPDTVPVYVEDYFGGKVIKQEATPVTILDEKGKATYALTKKPADKGKKFLLVREDDKF